MPPIDLNSDLGEIPGAAGLASDAAVLESVTSANVACGFHAGEPVGIRATCAAAVAAGVVIGAHPSYDDREGFGRRPLEVPQGELTDQIVYQIGALQAIARAASGEVRYVKPHGALYNAIAVREDQARAVVRAMREVAPELPLMVLPGSVVERVARDAGLRTVAEAFADRGYLPDGRLVPRGEAGAMLGGDAAVDQAVRLASDGRVRAADGSTLRLPAESICLHGDDPAAVALSRRIRATLAREGLEVRSFA